MLTFILYQGWLKDRVDVIYYKEIRFAKNKMLTRATTGHYQGLLTANLVDKCSCIHHSKELTLTTHQFNSTSFLFHTSDRHNVL